ncbi:uncharacterized protein PAC_16769 [Phialocephala subalpina]|uniref:Uncharacterized protein n=1 Tax=Phialocephala subalpina TaxID=576137 RepID=A0A1L7XPB7_9HELO|nr:uncharacterized protein PAC_16769 [Phialocephala subalpina]
MPWSVRPVPSAGQSTLQPVQADISCYTPDFYGEECADEEEEHATALELIDKYLWPEFIKLSQNKKLHEIYQEYLIGFSLQHPNPTAKHHSEYSRCHLEPFSNIPEDAPRFCETKFYHGPALAAATIADFLTEYGHLAKLIPTDYFASPHVDMAVRCVNTASVVMPGSKGAVHLTATGKTRSTRGSRYRIASLCPSSTKNTNVFDPSEEVASEPTSRDVVAAIYAVYTLRSAAPCLTSALSDLTDMKKQDTILWVQLAAGIAAVVLMPAAAPAAAIVSAEAAGVGAATGLVVATTTSVGAVGSSAITTVATTTSITVRGLGTLASGLGGGAFGFGGTVSVYAAADLADVKRTEIINKTINEKVEHMIYYLALCFMRSSGISNPRDQDQDLKDALDNLGGKRPPRNVQLYSAIHLHKLVREVAQDFKKVHQALVKQVKRPFQELGFTPSEFQEATCTFSF